MRTMGESEKETELRNLRGEVQALRLALDVAQQAFVDLRVKNKQLVDLVIGVPALLRRAAVYADFTHSGRSPEQATRDATALRELARVLEEET